MNSILGVVAASNTHGVKLEGEQDWRNFSKWSEGPITPPAPGAKVVLALDKSGYVRQVFPDPDAAPVAPSNGHGAVAPQPTPPVAPEPQPQLPAPLPSKDLMIARMNVLTTAVNILASGGRQVDPVEAVKLAGRLEQWICRA